MRLRYRQLYAPHPHSSVWQKVIVGVMDSSLKFALTALWNVTDEMPSAARNFNECQGLELYQEVLEVWEQPDRCSSEKHWCKYFPSFFNFYSHIVVNLWFSRKFLASWWVLSVWKHLVLSSRAQLKGTDVSGNASTFVLSHVIAEQYSRGSRFTVRPAGWGPPGTHSESDAGHSGGHGGPLLCRGGF